MTLRFRLEDTEVSGAGSIPAVTGASRIYYTSKTFQRCDCNGGSTSPGCDLADPKRTQEDLYQFSKAA